MAKEYGYSLEYIGSLSFAQIDALSEKTHHELTPEQSDRLLELMRKRRGL